MRQTPRSERLHIAIFGRRNVGKSSLINAITGQDTATVSPIKGTTTDPVYKAMEILPLGPVVLIDTAGLDDTGDLGRLRTKKTLDVLNKTDIAMVVIDGTEGITPFEQKIVDKLKQKKIPILGVINKADKRKLSLKQIEEMEETLGITCNVVSALNKKGIDGLKNALISKGGFRDPPKTIVADLLNPGDIVVLVVPIDESAPKGRLILPQQQVIRELLDHGNIALVTREYTLDKTLKSLTKEPELVITDSQIFKEISNIVPKGIPLTSFSILFARYKGDLDKLIKGAYAIENLKDGDRVLIAEGCTHHRQDEDIGRVKIPRWLTERTGREIKFEFTGGGDFPHNLDGYSLIIHCGGCMLNPKSMGYRLEKAEEYGVPIVNYGVLIAYLKGILDRTIKPFKVRGME